MNTEVTMRKVLLMALALAAVSIPGYLDAQILTSSIPYSTPNRGTFTIQTTQSPSITRVGYGRAQPTVSTTPTGVAIFSLRQNNVLVTEAGVPGTTAISSGRTYAEINGPVNTGLAIANPNSAPVVISFTFTDQFGIESGLT